MKNFLALLLLCATVILASCQKDESTTPVSEVTINKKAIALPIGEKETLTATVLPNNATDKDVTWSSSNTLIATVSTTGEVSAVSAGTATITVASVDDKTKTATCEVTVTAPTVAISGVTLNKNTLSLPIGEKETLIATVSPNEVTNKDVTWTSSDTLVAKVSTTGEVNAISAGTATIIVAAVNDKSKTDTCKVTITKSIVAISRITLNKSTLSLLIGEKETLIATVLPDEATKKDVTWTSSNASVATVSTTGEVSGVSVGTATIIVTAVNDKSKADTCKVTITKSTVAISRVTLNKSTLSLLIGKKETLIATVSPNEATNKNVTWTSSNASVATVSTTGEVSGVSVGTATITVASVDDKTKTATCVVTVTKSTVAISGVALNKSTLSLPIGKKETLIATVSPNEATNKNVTWTSSNTSVATVSTTGEVNAISVGTTKITVASVDDKTKAATCEVTVTKPGIAVTDVSLNKKTLPLLIGTKETLLATVLPNNATDKSVTWTSSDASVAKVSATGEVSAVGAGTATITVVSVNDKTKTDACTVTVTIPTSTTAAIGNFYYADKSMTSVYDKTKKCIGIVFWVDPNNKQKGKIVSLDEKGLEWSTNIESTGATNNTNGPSNMRQINTFLNQSRTSFWEDYPAFNWVATAKNGRYVGGWEESDMWYLPAQGDLVALWGTGGATMTTVNQSLNSISGAVALTVDSYCSSTEQDDRNAIFVSFSTGVSENRIKFSANKVRAVAAF